MSHRPEQPAPPKPPRLADGLLAWFCAPHVLEEVQGDLHELFEQRWYRDGLERARLLYWLDVLRSFRPSLISRRHVTYETAYGPIMLKNYLKITLRNLRRHPGYAFINIAGLALGIATCLLILLYVQDELAFDTFHPQADRTFRVVEARTSPDQGDQYFSETMGPLAPTLAAEFPEVTQAVRLVGRNTTGRFTVAHGENRYYSAEHLFAEPAVFDIFKLPMRQGNPETALDRPLTVVLTETSARQYFGEENPMGKVLQVERFGDFEVTGVLQDPPQNSHLQFSVLFSFATLENIEGWQRWMENWDSSGFITYLVLHDPQAADAVASRLPAIFAEHREEEGARTPSLQAMNDIHFQSGHIEFDLNAARGDITYLYIFSAIALFLVLIACINYMNMATARSMRRAREVGMRKVVGAHRGQLMRQFLSESMLVVLMALVLALGLVYLLLPAFNTLAAKDLTLNLAGNWPFLANLLGLVLLVGIISGSYPAFFLSKFRPAQVLKGSGESGRRAALLRRSLVVTQFALSIIMMVATLVVYNQMRYVQTKQLGFNEEHLLIIDINDGGVRRDFATVKQAFAQVPAVQSVSVMSNVPGDWKSITQIEVIPEGAPATDLRTMHFLGVDEDFIDTYELNLAQGRNFSHDFATDSMSVLLNETAAQMLGASVGDHITVPGSSLWSRFRDIEFRPRVVGIVKDFHFESLHQAIGPMVVGYRTNPIDVIDYFTTRINGSDVPTTLDQLRAVGEQFDPSHPFEYNFLDERLNDFYQNEQRIATLFGIAAMLAILIACLGLFGLAAFTAEQRTKEIGVRKVLGASASGIVMLLSRDFLKLVALGFVIAAPVAYLVMDRWLEDFAYRIDLSWSIFLVAGLAALGVALFTVSFQAIRAALADPVKSLRYE